MSDLRSDSASGYIQQTVIKPWTGEYSAFVKDEIVLIKKDFSPSYAEDFNHYWRNEIASAFPVAYSVNSWISVPIDMDMNKIDHYQIGEIDKSHIDVSMHEKRFEGYGVLGKSLDTPGVYNTWTIKAVAQEKIRIRYWASKPNFSKIDFIALRSVRLEKMFKGPDYIELTIKTFDDLAIFIAIVPQGSFVIDAIEIEKIK